MKLHWSRRLRLAPFAALVFGCTIHALAQDQAGNDGKAPRSEERDAIARAKKDFETIQAARDLSLRAEGQLPSVSMPQWHGGGAPEIVAPSSKAKTKSSQAPSGNWLVDAMQKSETKSNRARGQTWRDRDRERAKEGFDPAHGKDSSLLEVADRDEEEAERRAESHDEAREEETTAAINPLERYLGEWMTPGDYALLKSDRSEFAGAATASQQSLAIESITSGGNGATLGAFVPGLERAAKPGMASATPPPNPYLSTLTAPLPNLPNVATKSPPPIIPAPSPMVTAPPPTLSPPSKIPEFAKPSTDDKYFKQLKRF